MRIKMFFSLLLAVILLMGIGSALAEDNRVVIFSSAEDFRNEYFLNRLKEQFPDYDIVIEYMSSGSHAAKLQAEGTATDCDITLDLDASYLDMLSPILAELSDFDFSNFADDLVTSTKYAPFERNSGAVIVNTQVLEKNNLPMPESYADLLKPEFEGLLSMPNPKSSNSGYMAFKALVNAWGEEEAFDYFDAFADNVLAFTTSGSGPVNALLQGEVAVGLGMLAPAVTEINNGAPFKILIFDEGVPFCCNVIGLIEGRQHDKAAKEVFDFFTTTLCDENSEKWFPEYLFKDRQYEIENYPKDFKYSDMSGATLDEKMRLLDMWEY
jgi:ABC-type Fe3+ transport system, periplasmic component